MLLTPKLKKLLILSKRPKAFWNYKKYLLSNKFKPIHVPYYPIWTEVEISTKCNLNCPRCERQIAPESILDKNTPIETIEKISPMLPYVQFISLVSGLGEPFLNPNFWQIIKTIKGAGPAVGYTTNGILLNNENIEKTIKERVDIVVVSLESLKKDIYEKIRPGASLDKTIYNLNNLLSAKKKHGHQKPEIRLGFTFQKSTIEEMPGIIEFAHKIGVEMVHFTAFIAHKEELVNESPYLLPENYIKNIFKTTQKRASALGVKIRMPNIKIKKPSSVCSNPWKTMFVSYDGGVYCDSCHRVPQKQYFYINKNKIINKEIYSPDVLLGNIYEEPISKIWNNKNYINLRKRLKSAKNTPPCDNCYFLHNIH